MRSLNASHGLHAVDLPVASAAVHAVRADRQAHELLEQIQLFVRTAAGDQSTKSLAAIGLLESRNLLRGVFERFLPCRFNEMSVASEQRLGQLVRVGRSMASAKG